MPNLNLIRDYFLSELSNSSVETRRVRLLWAKKWLSFAGDRPFSEWNKMLVGDFRTSLEKEVKKNGSPKYTPLTIRSILQTVSRVFDAAKAVHEREKLKLIQSADPKDPTAMATIIQAMVSPAPDKGFGKRWLPEMQSEDRKHPAMPMEDLKKLIDAAKSGKFKEIFIFDKEVDYLAATAFLALASIYGLRKGEIARVLPEHINYEAGTIWIDTEKHGEKRNQLLVKEIVPYLKKYKFDIQYSPAQMHSMFIEMCCMARVKLVEHQNWHSLRRTLDTVLLDSLAGDPNLHRHAEYLVHIFLRWKSSGMTEHYYTPDDADKIVIQHHPITRLWK